MAPAHLAPADLDLADQPLGLRADEIDSQKSVVEACRRHFHAVCEHESPLELARRDASMEVGAAFVVVLPATDGKLAVFQRDIQVRARKSGNCESDSQNFALALAVGVRDALDIICLLYTSDAADE